MNIDNDYQKKAKEIVKNLTDNIKGLNENKESFDYMFSHIEFIKQALVKVGFEGNVLEDMIVFVMDKLTIDSDVLDFKLALFDEVSKSDYVNHLAEIHYYAYHVLKDKGYSHEHCLKLLSHFYSN